MREEKERKRRRKRKIGMMEEGKENNNCRKIKGKLMAKKVQCYGGRKGKEEGMSHI
jgi:hypothetical protein